MIGLRLFLMLRSGELDFKRPESHGQHCLVEYRRTEASEVLARVRASDLEFEALKKIAAMRGLLGFH